MIIANGHRGVAASRPKAFELLIDIVDIWLLLDDSLQGKRISPFVRLISSREQ